MSEPVQTIDILPTVLAALEIPLAPRIRGRDLGPVLSGQVASGLGLAVAETDEHALLAEGSLRLVCARRLGACSLYDLSNDPRQQSDISAKRPADQQRLRRKLREIGAGHGLYEQTGLRAEGRGFPSALLRGIAGDGDAAEDVAALLDDADAQIRRKACEVLFELSRPEVLSALRLSASREEEPMARNYCALALGRLGAIMPHVYELLSAKDPTFRRLAALVLAENGDNRGESVLLEWWADETLLDFARKQELVAAFGKLRSRSAVQPLLARLEDVRLRPPIARALAAIGDTTARPALLRALAAERSQTTRLALVEALIELGAGRSIVPALVSWMGAPDPPPDALSYALRANVLERVGGPSAEERERLRRNAGLGVGLTLGVAGSGPARGLRVWLRSRNTSGAPAKVWFEPKAGAANHSAPASQTPEAPGGHQALAVTVPVSNELVEVSAVLPGTDWAPPGAPRRCVVFAEPTVEVDAVALVPLTDEPF